MNPAPSSSDTQTGVRPANRLAAEKSPYLLQHARNPVHWQPWDQQAFDQAVREDKPIFLSIGYSTCHWCHVMERESFENESIAAVLNEHFVSIKVDREERPDVDQIYMMFVQATTGHGGWPLNVFLTPDRKPFFGGTYFPPQPVQGRPGFPQLLRHIQQFWANRRGEVDQSAAEIHRQLAQFAAQHPAPAALHPDLLRRAGTILKQAYDPKHGGFGGAPKFPHPSQPQFLLRYARRHRDAEAVRMVLHTCERMASGGIHDQLGGGFARYAVDAEWLVPHFEKMLYDNAQLAQLYLDAALVSGELDAEPAARPDSVTAISYAAVARGILEYVLRDLADPDGGFYSAEDADSEGHEGKFYCWTRRELETLLAPDEFAVAVRYFGITDSGNFIDHSHPHPLPNQNVLSIADRRLAPAEARALAAAKARMLEARGRRVRPHRDDKVLVSWNGLMLGAFARASAVLGEDAYRRAAERNLAFLKTRLWTGTPPPTGTLYHRWRDGQRDGVELLKGYAFLLSGVLELYEATLRPEHLEFAIALAETMLTRFYDPGNGGFWQSPAGAGDLVMRLKEDQDGAEPSGNSVATLALLKLGGLTGRAEFIGAADKTLRLFGARLEQLPQAMPYLLQAVDFRLQEPRRLVVSGDPDAARTRELLQAIHSVYDPNRIVLGTLGPVEPFAQTLPERNGPVVYPCCGQSCQAPISDPAELRRTMLLVSQRATNSSSSS